MVCLLCWQTVLTTAMAWRVLQGADVIGMVELGEKD